jgi:hypothetical protein
MEAICFSETSVDFQRITPRYIPEDNTVHNHRCENLKSYKDRLICDGATALFSSSYYISMVQISTPTVQALPSRMEISYETPRKVY